MLRARWADPARRHRPDAGRPAPTRLRRTRDVGSVRRIHTSYKK
ncbi:hypothetical protein LA76x_0746 [Lysobacter antibioticus]|uniref:Uncharacterized protein n=1 Tax=Lysobacter antibioticus TaxID=84531 RepID=A0A0S2F5V4_LYSAN|nr:hypothetical protein LA76x_0746 [Lysobacter antibioticus]